jgi:hypothetical protein
MSCSSRVKMTGDVHRRLHQDRPAILSRHTETIP